MAIKKIECPNCGKKTNKRAHNAKYCSAICRQQAYEKRKGIKPYERSKKRTKGISSPTQANKETTTQSQLPSQYYTNPVILQELSGIEIRVIELRKKRRSLLIKFNNLSTKNEKVINVITGISAVGGMIFGAKSINRNTSDGEALFRIIGIPALFGLAGNNLSRQFFINDQKTLNKINNLKFEISAIDEEITTLELQSINERAVRKNLEPVIERTDSYTTISAPEMKKIKRTTYKLKDKWKYFLGEIEQNFKAIIHGKPKQGKSHFSIQFAQYLHSNHGDVAYFAAEEGVAMSMETKASRWGAEFNIVYNILGIKGIGDYIKKYEPKFVFIDSISRLGLSADNVNFLVDEYIDVAWLFITQSTKHNGHRGSMELTHLADSVIHVDKAVAYQQGRTVNGDTEIEVFPSNDIKSK